MGFTKQLDFEITREGHFSFFADGFVPKMYESCDFWRIQLDDGEIREIEALSSAQKEFDISVEGNVTKVHYPSITDVLGRRHDMQMTVFIEKRDGKLVFSCDLENHAIARINELQMPFIDVLDFPCAHEEEEFFLPNGLGQRILNPREHYKRMHTEYTSADYKQSWHVATYPPASGANAALSMAWEGLQCGEHFLYLGSEDKDFSIVLFANGVSPRKTPSRFLWTLSHYPALEKGESIHIGDAVVALFKGDWRDAAKYYKSWASATWYKGEHKSPDWVIDMNGWQRIILKHQYGEIFFKYADLPRLYLEGKQYGINTLLVFGWWKGRFDNNYPEYEADPALGGEDGLRKAIAEVQRLGGRVCLYTNGNLIDIKTNFYKNIGKKICTKDIDENEYREHYRFGNSGTLLKTFGYKSFVTACHCNKEWQDRLIENGKLKLSFGADCIFYDQLSVCLKLCFDKSHSHGNRVDREAQGRLDNIRAIYALLNGDKALGSEWVTDRYATEYDFTHGCGYGMSYENSRALFPDLFLSTFPECKTSNRFIHDDKDGFRDHLNYAFVKGLLFDVSIYRGRVFGIAGLPDYAEHIKKLCDLRDKYAKFFKEGRFETTYGEGYPDNIHMGRFVNNGESIYTIFNPTNSDITLEVKGQKVTISAKDIAIVE